MELISQPDSKQLIQSLVLPSIHPFNFTSTHTRRYCITHTSTHPSCHHLSLNLGSPSVGQNIHLPNHPYIHTFIHPSHHPSLHLTSNPSNYSTSRLSLAFHPFHKITPELISLDLSYRPAFGVPRPISLPADIPRIVYLSPSDGFYL